MNPKLPSYVLLIATLIILSSTWAKQNQLTVNSLGRSEVFEWGCAIVSSACIAIGLVLALFGLATQAPKRTYFLSLLFWAIATVCWAPGLQFAEYVLFTKLYHVGEIPDMMPKLVENARILEPEGKRRLVAENAFKIYGATIAYRQDNGEPAYYKPTAEDVAFQNKFA